MVDEKDELSQKASLKIGVLSFEECTSVQAN